MNSVSIMLHRDNLDETLVAAVVMVAIRVSRNQILPSLATALDQFWPQRPLVACPLAQMASAIVEHLLPAANLPIGNAKGISDYAE